MMIRPLTILKTATIAVAVFGAGCQMKSPAIPPTAIETSSSSSSFLRRTSVSSVEPQESTLVSEVSIPINADVFLDKARFHDSANVTSTVFTGLPIAGVVNHHALASDFLQRFFNSLCDARPDLKRVIILAPDHYRQGSEPISIETFPYVTQGYVVPLDTEVLTALQEQKISAGSRAMFEREHGIGALIPFFARACPEVKIVPLAIRSDASPELLSSLTAKLAPFMTTDTFIVVSADMSHYLAEDEALRNDLTTETWLQTLDETAMLSATDDFTDNGRSFTVLFSFLKQLGQPIAFERIDHSISSRYGGDPTFTTSYLTGVWSVASEE